VVATRSEECARCEDDVPNLGRGKGSAALCEFPGCRERAVTVVRGKRYCAVHAVLMLSGSLTF